MPKENPQQRRARERREQEAKEKKAKKEAREIADTVSMTTTYEQGFIEFEKITKLVKPTSSELTGLIGPNNRLLPISQNIETGKTLAQRFRQAQKHLVNMEQFLTTTQPGVEDFPFIERWIVLLLAHYDTLVHFDKELNLSVVNSIFLLLHNHLKTSFVFPESDNFRTYFSQLSNAKNIMNPDREKFFEGIIFASLWERILTFPEPISFDQNQMILFIFEYYFGKIIADIRSKSEKIHLLHAIFKVYFKLHHFYSQQMKSDEVIFYRMSALVAKCLHSEETIEVMLRAFFTKDCDPQCLEALTSFFIQYLNQFGSLHRKFDSFEAELNFMTTKISAEEFEQDNARKYKVRISIMQCLDVYLDLSFEYDKRHYVLLNTHPNMADFLKYFGDTPVSYSSNPYAYLRRASRTVVDYITGLSQIEDHSGYARYEETCIMFLNCVFKDANCSDCLDFCFDAFNQLNQSKAAEQQSSSPFFQLFKDKIATCMTEHACQLLAAFPLNHKMAILQRVDSKVDQQACVPFFTMHQRLELLLNPPSLDDPQDRSSSSMPTIASYVMHEFQRYQFSVAHIVYYLHQQLAYHPKTLQVLLQHIAAQPNFAVQVMQADIDCSDRSQLEKIWLKILDPTVPELFDRFQHTFEPHDAQTWLMHLTRIYKYFPEVFDHWFPSASVEHHPTLVIHNDVWHSLWNHAFSLLDLYISQQVSCSLDELICIRLTLLKVMIYLAERAPSESHISEYQIDKEKIGSTRTESTLPLLQNVQLLSRRGAYHTQLGELSRILINKVEEKLGIEIGDQSDSLSIAEIQKLIKEVPQVPTDVFEQWLGNPKWTEEERYALLVLAFLTDKDLPQVALSFLFPDLSTSWFQYWQSSKKLRTWKLSSLQELDEAEQADSSFVFCQGMKIYEQIDRFARCANAMISRGDVSYVNSPLHHMIKGIMENFGEVLLQNFFMIAQDYPLLLNEYAEHGIVQEWIKANPHLNRPSETLTFLARWRSLNRQKHISQTEELVQAIEPMLDRDCQQSGAFHYKNLKEKGTLLTSILWITKILTQMPAEQDQPAESMLPELPNAWLSLLTKLYAWMCNDRAKYHLTEHSIAFNLYQNAWQQLLRAIRCFYTTPVDDGMFELPIQEKTYPCDLIEKPISVESVDPHKLGSDVQFGSEHIEKILKIIESATRDNRWDFKKVEYTVPYFETADEFIKYIRGLEKISFRLMMRVMSRLVVSASDRQDNVSLKQQIIAQLEKVYDRSKLHPSEAENGLYHPSALSINILSWQKFNALNFSALSGFALIEAANRSYVDRIARKSFGTIICTLIDYLDQCETSKLNVFLFYSFIKVLLKAKPAEYLGHMAKLKSIFVKHIRKIRFDVRVQIAHAVRGHSSRDYLLVDCLLKLANQPSAKPLVVAALDQLYAQIELSSEYSDFIHKVLIAQLAIHADDFRHIVNIYKKSIQQFPAETQLHHQLLAYVLSLGLQLKPPPIKELRQLLVHQLFNSPPKIWVIWLEISQHPAASMADWLDMLFCQSLADHRQIIEEVFAEIAENHPQLKQLFKSIIFDLEPDFFLAVPIPQHQKLPEHEHEKRNESCCELSN